MIIGIKKEEFDKATRRFYINGDIAFYKGKFIYDNDLTEEALKFLPFIKEYCNVKTANIWVEAIKPDEGNPNWEYNYNYGEIDKKIIF